MQNNLAQSGISCVGEVPWGTHFCQFYDNSEDLIETLIPFFKAGLDNGESCLWVTSEPFTVTDATDALRAAVPDLDRRMTCGQIELIDRRDWYTPYGRFDAEDVMRGWVQKKAELDARGFDGLRVTGDTFWLDGTDQFSDFTDYEARINQTFKEHRIVCLCSYCVGQIKASGVLDVVRSHEFAVARRDGEWEVIESATVKTAKEELRRVNETLEERVHQRTAELERALAEKETLLKEVHHRVKNNLQVISSMLFLKSRDFPDAAIRTSFSDVLHRITAMSLVHEALYQYDDSSRIDFSNYLETLGNTLVSSYGMSDQVRFRVGSVGGSVDLQNAVPLGLASAEAITNALKHAFPNGRRGVILASFTQETNSSLLTVRDDGIGIPLPDQRATRLGAGLMLLNAIAAQVEGTAMHTVEGGTTFSLHF
jgi:two-component sensor histidine kinase